jgi:lysyl-tRNA synthetase class 2
LFRTRTDELTIKVEDFTFLAKAIRPLPEKFHDMSLELKSRRRHLDLAMNLESRERFKLRSRIVADIRSFFNEEEFLEVETPVLQPLYGGATARPFTTHHNALDIDLFMRIALELHLKRLLVGGIERVYELGRVYRNEGISPKHNPEFTMLEVYQAYGDYRTMMELTEKLIVDAIGASGQELKLPWGDAEVDFTPPFPRKTYDELFAEHAGAPPDDPDAIRAAADALGLDTAGKHSDVVKNELFEAKVEDALVGPIFVTDYPASICPLTKRKRDNAQVAERFELFIRGMEVANAYTELNDPDLQEALFAKQVEGLAEEESMAKMDHDFVRALRHGMPPAGGLGVGIDRLVMLLTNSQTIREVILFPLLRPEAE